MLSHVFSFLLTLQSMIFSRSIYMHMCHLLSGATATPGMVVRQAPLSIESSRQEYWSGLPFPSPGGLPNPGIRPGSPSLQAYFLPSEPPGKPTYDFIWDIYFPSFYNDFWKELNLRMLGCQSGSSQLSPLAHQQDASRLHQELWLTLGELFSTEGQAFFQEGI